MTAVFSTKDARLYVASFSIESPSKAVGFDNQLVSQFDMSSVDRLKVVIVSVLRNKKIRFKKKY